MLLDVDDGPAKPAGSAGALVGGSKRGAPGPSGSSEDVPPDPVSALRHLDGADVLRLTREAKKGTIVNIWATWCGPCREELPMLHTLAERLAEDGVRLLLVSVDEPESEQKIPEMMARFGFEPPFYVASRPLGAFKRALHPVWPGNIPVTFLYDHDARRRYFWGGPVMEKEVAPIVVGLIEGRRIDGEARFELAPGQTIE